MKNKINDINGQVFRDNEVAANIIVAKFLVVCAVVLTAIWGLNSLGILEIGEEYVMSVFMVGLLGLFVPAMICFFLNGEGRWIKYLLMISLIVTLAYLDCILTFNVTLLIILPVVFSCWYYSGRFTVAVAILATVAFTVSAYLGAYINFDTPDMNFIAADRTEYIRSVMLLSFLPRWMVAIIVFGVCYVIAVMGRNMVFKQDEISRSNAKVMTEMEMANRIQTEALPNVDELEKCPFREFDIAARMKPARNVGGDFYDFFYVDPTHLALIIADVSDKGVGAALFMMVCKLLLDNKLALCSSPGQVLEEVNDQLRAKGWRTMFVTVWLGILDLETGDLYTANAGHEYPVIMRSGGNFELFKDKHGFVLGGMDGMKYKETHLRLEEGDMLFVYTDGVPEANNIKGEFFGVDRMLESLNRHKDCTADELIKAVKNDLDEFAEGAPQFDDTTMLALRLHG